MTRWWIAEILPKRFKDPRKNFKTSWRIPLGRRRFISEESTLHGSVVARIERTKETGTPYNPPRLPESYDIEPWNEGGADE